MGFVEWYLNVWALMLARGRYNIYIWRGVVYGCCRRRLKANNQQSTILDGQRKSGGGGGSDQWWFVERLQIRIICGLDTGGRGCSLTILNNNLLDYDDLQKMSLGSLSTNIIVGTIFKGVDFRWTYRQWRYRASELIFRQYSVHRSTHL